MSLTNDLILDLCEEIGSALLRVCAKHGRSQNITKGAELQPYCAPKVDVRQQELPLPEPTPAVVEVVAAPVQVLAPVVEVAPALVVLTEQNLEDEAFPKATMLQFLAQRGHDAEAYSSAARSDVVVKCREVLASLVAVGAGVKTRKPRTPKAPLQVLPVVEDTFDKEMDKLSPEVLQKLGETLRITATPVGGFEWRSAVKVLVGDGESLVSTVGHILDTQPEPKAEEPKVVDSDPEEGEIVAVVPAPTAAPVPVVETPMVVVVQSMVNGQRLIEAVTKKYGYEGVLYDFITSPELGQDVIGMQTLMQKLAANAADPAKARVFQSYFTRMAAPGQTSCLGSCSTCMRGGAQIAVCSAIVDEDFPDHKQYQTGLLSGSLQAKMLPTGRLPDDPGAEPQVATIETVK